MAYRIVLAEKARTPVSERTPVAVACELLGVSTSGFYGWASRAPSDRALSDAWLVEKIKAIHAANRGVYGSRRVTAELRLGEGVVVSRKRVQRLMRVAGLSGLTKVTRGRTTIRVAGVPCRRRPRRAQHAYSRRIVGWSMADHMRQELVVTRSRWLCVGAGPPRARFITPTTAGSRESGVRPEGARRRHRRLDGLQGRLLR